MKTLSHLLSASLPVAFLSLSAFTLLAGSPIQPVPDETHSTDKSVYNLFNPTPRELWRDLSPDRPDATESPHTVDAGAWVIEASFFDWRRDGGDDSYTIMSTNLKLGLTNSTDLQFVFDTFTWEDPATGKGAEGFGDMQLRLKQNLWGNDGGDTAFAILCNEVDLMKVDKSILYLQNDPGESFHIIITGSVSFFFEQDRKVQNALQLQHQREYLINDTTGTECYSVHLGQYVTELKVLIIYSIQYLMLIL